MIEFWHNIGKDLISMKNPEIEAIPESADVPAALDDKDLAAVAGGVASRALPCENTNDLIKEETMLIIPIS